MVFVQLKNRGNKWWLKVLTKVIIPFMWRTHMFPTCNKTFLNYTCKVPSQFLPLDKSLSKFAVQTKNRCATKRPPETFGKQVIYTPSIILRYRWKINYLYRQRQLFLAKHWCIVLAFVFALCNVNNVWMSHIPPILGNMNNSLHLVLKFICEFFLTTEENFITRCKFFQTSLHILV